MSEEDYIQGTINLKITIPPATDTPPPQTNAPDTPSIELLWAYGKRGLAQRERGDWEAALESYNQAIKIGEQLPTDRPDYQHDLASAYNNRGLLQRDRHDWDAALESSNQAIKIREQLPKDRPDYQRGLASAYNNRGLVQSDRHNWEAALESYNQAINIGEQLPTDQPDYQYILVKTYYNRGLVQSDRRDREAALESYNQAIKILEQLPTDRPDYQHDLASAYYNRGVVQSDRHDWEAALESFNKAINIGEQLPTDRPDYQHELASAYYNKGVLYFHREEAETANEWVEKALELLRALEIQGIFWYRADRERYFDATIKTYLACCAHFLPGFLLKHLDPENPGAAPQSDAMHQAALRGLLTLYQKTAQVHAPELITEIEATLEKLAQIRSLYFMGSASGAALTAQFYEENVQDVRKAEEILRIYTEKQPADPAGYFQLADFYVRRNAVDKAREFYLKTAFVLTTPDSSLAGAKTDTALYRLLDFMITKFFLADAFDYPKQAGPSAEEYLTDCYQRAEHWLDALPEALRKDLTLTLLKEILPAFKNEWAEQTTTLEAFKKWQTRQEATLSTKHQDVKQAIANLPLTWHQYHQKVQYTLQEASAWIEKQTATQDQVEVEKKMRPVLDEIMKRLYRQRHTGEYNPQLFELLGEERYLELSAEEHEYLTHALELNEMKRFPKDVGSNLGRAVEARLLSAFEQCRQNLVNQVVVLTEQDRHSSEIMILFIRGKREPTLGTLVRELQHTVFNKIPDLTHPIRQGIILFFNRQAPVLINQSPEFKGERIGRMRKIAVTRNLCSHARSHVDVTQIAEMLEHVLTHPHHAFFRYFPKI